MSVLPRQVALVSESQSVSFSDLSLVAAALQKQATRDFGPVWQVNATVDAFPSLDKVPLDYWPVIIQDDIKQPGAAGYHTDKNGQPFALVQVDATWALTVSHETLEMLADPSGNRVLAGAPPPQAPKPVSQLARVLYLVEVCDPCEANKFSYTVNGVQVSDFITNHYYDPRKTKGRQYSFTGAIPSPHRVLDGGYVSFSDPVTNHWYQIVVQGTKVQLVDLGVMNMNGKSIRENIDRMTRERRPGYRTAPAKAAKAKAAAAGIGSPESQSARASALREEIIGLKG
jgi:hypothetical protein